MSHPVEITLLVNDPRSPLDVEEYRFIQKAILKIKQEDKVYFELKAHDQIHHITEDFQKNRLLIFGSNLYLQDKNAHKVPLLFPRKSNQALYSFDCIIVGATYNAKKIWQHWQTFDFLIYLNPECQSKVREVFLKNFIYAFASKNKSIKEVYKFALSETAKITPLPKYLPQLYSKNLELPIQPRFDDISNTDESLETIINQLNTILDEVEKLEEELPKDKFFYKTYKWLSRNRDNLVAKMLSKYFPDCKPDNQEHIKQDLYILITLLEISLLDENKEILAEPEVDLHFADEIIRYQNALNYLKQRSEGVCPKMEYTELANFLDFLSSRLL